MIVYSLNANAKINVGSLTNGEDYTTSSTSAFEEIDKNSQIIWEGAKVSLEEKEKIDEFESIGIGGQPDWLQEAEIPKYPKHVNSKYN